LQSRRSILSPIAYTTESWYTQSGYIGNSVYKNSTMKKNFVLLWLFVLLSGIITLFWYNSWVYLLPTPVPKDYRPVPAGSHISLYGPAAIKEAKPTFLHFFNPDCPCSRFNIKHFQSLVGAYGHQVNFVVVVMSDKKYSVKAVQERLGLNLPVMFDTSIAKRCGVYSTPQAVLVNSKSKIFYRGNYNKSRYCTDENTNYAKIALVGLLGNMPTMAFDEQALKSYGCSLPYCKK
jgi:hypothetical protein